MIIIMINRCNHDIDNDDDNDNSSDDDNTNILWMIW